MHNTENVTDCEEDYHQHHNHHNNHHNNHNNIHNNNNHHHQQHQHPHQQHQHHQLNHQNQLQNIHRNITGGSTGTPTPTPTTTTTPTSIPSQTTTANITPTNCGLNESIIKMEYNTIPPPPLPTSSSSSSSSSSSLSTSISSSSSSISSCNSNSISTSSLSSASSSSSSSSLSIAAAAATSSKITNASTSPNSHTNLTTIATPITTINNMGNTNGNDVMANGGGGGGNGGSNGNTIISNGNIHSNSAICCKCDEPIKHRYLLRALDLFWHEDCLKCDCCGCRLGEVGSTLYTKSNLILCKRDYLRIYGTSGYCAACNKTIPAFEMVMRAKTNVYHLDCFACQQCNHRFCVGDQFYLCDNKILCVYDYEERLVFASMPCNPTNLAHIRRQVSSLQPVGDSALNNCGNLDIQNGNNRNIQLPIHTREFPSMYINEKFPILIDQHQLHQLQQHQHQHPQQHLHQQVQPQPQPPQPPQPPQQPHHPSNIGHQPRDDGSSGYGSPDSETLETSPQTQQ